VAELDEPPDLTSGRRAGLPASDLRAASVRGALVVLGVQGLQLLAVFATLMLLLRLLTPRDFGLMAMASVSVGFADAFRDFGLRTAVVARGGMTASELSALFWLNLRLTGLLALAMAVSALGLAWFFAEPALVLVVLVLTLGIVADNLVNVHFGLLQRELRFRAIAVAEACAAGLGAAAAILGALLGAGYWALASQQLVGFLAHGTVLWAACRWRPERPSVGRTAPRGGEFDAAIAFGRDTTWVRLFGALADQLDRILVGRIAGPAALGLYHTARRWAVLPSTQLLTTLKPVAVSTFSRLQNEPERYRAYVREALGAVFSVILPASLFLCLEARRVLLILAGPQWLEAVPIFQLLVVGAMFDCARQLTTWLFLSESQTGRYLRWNVLSRPALFAGILGGAPWGAIGVAAGSVIAKAALTVPMVRFCLATSPLRTVDFWQPALRPALATLGTGLVALALGPSPLAAPAVLALLRDLALLGGTYVVLWLAMPGNVTRIRALFRSAGSLRSVLGAGTDTRP
jgi:PST family polysaccharide transporter